MLAGPISFMISMPARAMYALITGGVPTSNRLAVGDQSSVCASNANGSARPNQPVTVGRSASTSSGRT